MNRFIDIIVSRYKAVLIVSLLLTLAAGWCLRSLHFNHTADVYFKHDDPRISEYNDFQDLFGSEELGVIIFEDKDIFSNDVLGIVRDLSRRIGGLDNIEKVYSITEQQESVTLESDTLESRPVIPEGHLDPKALADTRKRVLSNQSITGRLISEDGTVGAIAFEVSRHNDSMEKILLMDEVKKIATETVGKRLKLHFNGVPFFESEENKLTAHDLALILPMMVLLSWIVIQVLFRSLSLNVICFLTLSLINILVMGLFSLAGESINIVTSIMAAVLINVSMADLIHFIAHYKDELNETGHKPPRAIAKTIRDIWQPCLFTSLTTAVGFVSFLSATIRPIQVLGLYTAIGTMIAFLMTLTFFPAAILLFHRTATPFKNKRRPVHANPLIHLLDWLGDVTVKRAKMIRLVFFAVMALSVMGITKVTFKANTMNVFKDDNPMVVDLKFIENNLGGAMNSELVVTANSMDHDFSHPESLAKLDEIQAYFSTLKDKKFVSSSFSAANYFKEVHKAFNNGDNLFYTLPESPMTLTDYYEIGDSDIINRFITRDRKKARITYQIYNNALEKRDEYLNELDLNLKKILGPDYSYIITGTSHLWSSLDRNLKQSFMSSFIFACIVIFLMMIYICKGLKLALLSMVPNIIPIMMTIGLMGWLDLPFDTLTVMIVCVTLGINVDDTVHFIVWFRRSIKEGLSVESALVTTFRNVGTSIISTSIILAMGFVVLSFGAYKPYETFGLLTAFNIMMALIADLLLLPALILWFEKSAKRIPADLHYAVKKAYDRGPS